MITKTIKQLTQIAESCYLCKNPRCTKNCPIHTPIPESIALFKEGKIEEAGQLLFENNPLTAICGIVCPHEKSCYGHCIRGIKDVPVSFYEIETFISGEYLKTKPCIELSQKEERIAVIGGGAAGIALSLIMAAKGYSVTLFEMYPKIGGVLRYGIPEFRLPRQLLDELETRLLTLGVQIRCNTLVGPVITLDKLLEDGYQAVFIGTGVWNPIPLGIKGETLGHVHYAIDYLRAPQNCHLGECVLVIGAGNVAMDAARTAKYYGAKKVCIVYRKDAAHMPAIREEVEAAKDEGVAFIFFSAPLEITKEGLKVIKTRSEEDAEGKITWQNIKGSEEVLLADTVIIAVSQGPKANIVAHTKGLETNRWGNLVIDEWGRTTRKGVYASGDVVTGANTVVEAVAAAKKTAIAIEEDFN